MDEKLRYIELWDEAQRRLIWVRADKIVAVAEAGQELCTVTWESGDKSTSTPVQASAKSVLAKIAGT